MQAETVALVITIMVSGLGSSLATIRILLHQMNQMEVRLTDQIKENRTAIGENRTAIEENRAQIIKNSAKLDEHSRRLDDIDGRLNGQQGESRDMAGEIQKVRESLARVEGFLMGSGDFRLSAPGPLTGEEPAPGG